MASVDDVLNSDKLPSLPQVALRILEISNSPDPDPIEVAACVRNDPALSAQFLRVVNNAIFGFRGKTTTVESAVLKLGLNMTQSVALSFYLVSKPEGEKDWTVALNKFWWRALAQGCAAEQLGRMMDPATASEFFLGGMLQDIGSLSFLNTHFEEYNPVYGAVNSAKFIELEEQYFGFSHVEVASHLFGRWKIADTLSEPMLLHHQPIKPTEINSLSPHRIAFRVASLVADSLFLDLPSQSDKMNSDAMEMGLLLSNHFGIEDEESQIFFDDVLAKVESTAQGFEIELKEFPKNDEILSRANELLSDLALRAMKQKNETDLEVRDPLTGVFNRRMLERVSLESRSESVGVLSIDIDNYLVINEKFGAETSDAVIVSLAKMLETKVRKEDCLIRYGDDEFIIIFANATSDQVAAIADRINDDIINVTNQFSFDFDVTLSIGGAYDRLGRVNSNYGSSLSELIQSADLALYKAKQRGGNRVCFAEPRE